MKTTKLILLLHLLLSLSIYSQNEAIGKSFIQAFLQEKDMVKSYTFFDDIVKSKVSESLLKDTGDKLESQLGQFKRIIETNSEADTYFYYSEFEKMKLDIKISLGENKKIVGFFFSPHREFRKEPSLGEELGIKSNTIELKGTLLLSKENDLKKLVIFVHGSGPQDRDETTFENKPFRDIAEDLYKRGIASYRFDKRTLSNPESFTDKSTVYNEVSDDVVNIVKYFKQDARFSQYEIIVLGHSLGANLMPHIANQSAQISKIILLAGNSRPLDQLLLEQYQHLYQLNPTPEMEKEVKEVQKQIAKLNSKDFNLNTPKEELPLNVSAYYWKSMLDYNPLKEAKNIKIPVLILQGERDYQVTMKDFALWKSTLKANKKATFISYPKLNHLFMSGDGAISDPKEYEVKGNVDENVINDIYNFIAKK